MVCVFFYCVIVNVCFNVFMRFVCDSPCDRVHCLCVVRFCVCVVKTCLCRVFESCCVVLPGLYCLFASRSVFFFLGG